MVTHNSQAAAAPSRLTDSFVCASGCTHTTTLMPFSYHSIFLRHYHFLKPVSFLGDNRRKNASIGPWLLRGYINTSIQCNTIQFGMASLCRYAHSLERILRHSFLNLRRFYLVVLGLGAPLSSPT